MHRNQKIGLGIVTCKRPKTFAQLLSFAMKSAIADQIVVVKNKNFDYGDDDPMKTAPSITCLEPRDVGVGACKNIAFKKLLDGGCQHIFIAEDDVHLKSCNVLETYIKTAEKFNIEHLNFCGAYDQLVTHAFLKPYLALKHGQCAIDLYRRLCGVFSYYTASALREVGLMDEHYINALEHCEHTYRMSLAGKCPPFYSFADVHNANELLEDLGTATTIEHNQLYNQRLVSAGRHFAQTYGFPMSAVHIPDDKQVIEYIDSRLDMKKQKG